MIARYAPIVCCGMVLICSEIMVSVTDLHRLEVIFITSRHGTKNY
jgi:hypothetical protein